MTAAPTKPRFLSTAPVRMRYDLVEKLDAVLWWKGFPNTADGVDAVLRAVIEELFDATPEAVQQRALARIARIEAEMEANAK